MKTDLQYQQRTCSPMTLVSGNIRYMRIFSGNGASNDNGVVENGDFQYFRSLFLQNFRDKATIIILY